MRCYVAHARERPDAQAAVRSRFNPAHTGQAINVEEVLWKSGAVLHQAEQVGTPGDKRDLAVLRVSGDGFCRIVGS